MLRAIKRLLGLVKCGRCGHDAWDHVWFDEYSILGCDAQSKSWKTENGLKRVVVEDCDCPLTKNEVIANYG